MPGWAGDRTAGRRTGLQKAEALSGSSAEYDPLLQETQEYADRLATSGTAVSLSIAPLMIHGFMRGVGVSSAARQEMAALAGRLEPYLKPR